MGVDLPTVEARLTRFARGRLEAMDRVRRHSVAVIGAVLLASCAADANASRQADQVEVVAPTTAPFTESDTQLLALDPEGKFPGAVRLPEDAYVEPFSASDGVMDVPTEIAAVRDLAEADKRAYEARQTGSDPSAESGLLEAQERLKNSLIEVPTYTVRLVLGDELVMDPTGVSIRDIADVVMVRGDLYTPELNEIALSGDNDKASAITVRDRSAVLLDLDEFGLAVEWQERPGLALVVSVKSGDQADLLSLVESMQF